MTENNELKRPSDTSDDELYGEADDTVIGRAFIFSLVAIAALIGIGLVLFFVLQPASTVEENRETDQGQLSVRERNNGEAGNGGSGAGSRRVPKVTFTDVTSAAGIDFIHESGATGEKLLPETMGGGCAFFDYDSDGDADILFVNSRHWEWDRGPETKPAVMGLFRNNGDGTFENATSGSGLELPIYGMGCAVGDFDNDGDSDLFLSAVGQNRLYRNDDGMFVDITSTSGVAGDSSQWSTSCGWLDYDNDGWLDLYVCNYVQWSREIDLGQDFRIAGVGRAYGPPTAFSGAYPYLYHNEGDGTFKDVSAEMGIQVKNSDTGVPVAKSMGVAPIDINGDGWIDLIVANDTVRNFLFVNEKGKRFAEMGEVAGIAFDSKGSARGAMGIDTANFRNGTRAADSSSDAGPLNLDTIGVAIGNFANEMSALYVSEDRQLNFRDEAISTGLGPPTRLDLTFGLFFFDYDLDGRLDLFGANGHLEEEINKVQPSQFHAQQPQLFWNAGLGGRSEFIRVGVETLGDGFLNRIVGRGASFADIDGDGDTDVLLTSSGGKPRLLRNDQETGHHWVRLQLTGRMTNRDAIGSWVEVYAGQDVYRRQVMPTRSYLSQSEKTVTIGIGSHPAIDKAIIYWAGGKTQEILQPAVDSVIKVQESP